MRKELNMLDKDIEKLNSQTVNKDDHIIIAIRKLYIQEFAEDNYGRKLTEAELEELSWLVWEGGEQYIWDWLNEAISQIIPEEEIAKHRERELKEYHEIKGGNHD